MASFKQIYKKYKDKYSGDKKKGSTMGSYGSKKEKKKQLDSAFEGMKAPTGLYKKRGK